MSIKIKRVSAWILTLVMLISMFPVNVFAEEQQEAPPPAVSFEDTETAAGNDVSAEKGAETSGSTEETSEPSGLTEETSETVSEEESVPSSQEDEKQPSEETAQEEEPSAPETGKEEKQSDASQTPPAENASAQTSEEPEYDEIVINQQVEYEADPEEKQTLRLILKEETNLHLFIDGMDLRIEAYNEYYKDEEFEPTDLDEHNDYLLKMPAGSYLLSFQPVKWVYGKVTLFFMDDETAENFFATLRGQQKEAVVPDHRIASYAEGDFNSVLDEILNKGKEQEEETGTPEETGGPVPEDLKEEPEVTTEAGADSQADKTPAAVTTEPESGETTDTSGKEAEETAPAEKEAEETPPVEKDAEETAPTEKDTEETAPAEKDAEETAPVEKEAEETAPVEKDAEEKAPVVTETEKTTPAATEPEKTSADDSANPEKSTDEATVPEKETVSASQAENATEQGEETVLNQPEDETPAGAPLTGPFSYKLIKEETTLSEILADCDIVLPCSVTNLWASSAEYVTLSSLAEQLQGDKGNDWLITANEAFEAVYLHVMLADGSIGELFFTLTVSDSLFKTEDLKVEEEETQPELNTQPESEPIREVTQSEESLKTGEESARTTEDVPETNPADEPKEESDADEPKEESDTAKPTESSDTAGQKKTEEAADEDPKQEPRQEPFVPADLSNGPFYYTLKNEPVTLDEVFTALGIVLPDEMSACWTESSSLIVKENWVPIQNGLAMDRIITPNGEFDSAELHLMVRGIGQVDIIFSNPEQPAAEIPEEKDETVGEAEETEKVTEEALEEENKELEEEKEEPEEEKEDLQEEITETTPSTPEFLKGAFTCTLTEKETKLSDLLAGCHIVLPCTVTTVWASSVENVTVTMLKDALQNDKGNDWLITANNPFEAVYLHVVLADGYIGEITITLTNPEQEPELERKNPDNDVLLADTLEEKKLALEPDFEEKPGAELDLVYSFNGLNDYAIGRVILEENGVIVKEVIDASVDVDNSVIDLAYSINDYKVTALDYFESATLTLVTDGDETYTVILTNPKPEETEEEEEEKEEKKEEEPVALTSEQVSVTSLDVSEFAAMLGIENTEATEKLPEVPMLRMASPKLRMETPAAPEEAPEKAPEDADKIDETPVTYTRSGYTGFDISADTAEIDEAGTFVVPVSLAAPIDMVGEENAEVEYSEAHLWHIVENEPVEIMDVDWDIRDGKIYGFTFETESFSPFMVSYTVDFTYTDPETGETRTFSFPGRGDYALGSILDELLIKFDTIESATLELTETVGEKDVDDEGNDALYLTGDVETGYVLHSHAAFDDVYTLTVDADKDMYVITVRDGVALSGVNITFYAMDGVTVDTSANVANCYAVICNGNDVIAVAPIHPVNGVASLNFIDKYNNSYTISNYGTNWGEDGIYFAKADNSNILLNAQKWEIEGTYKADTLDYYSPQIPGTLSNGILDISAIKQPEYKVTLNFVSVDQTAPVIPGQDGAESITDITYVGAHVRDSSGYIIGYVISQMPTSSSSNAIHFDNVYIFGGTNHNDHNQLTQMSYADAKNAGYYINDVAVRHYEGTQQSQNAPSYDEFMGSDWTSAASDGYAFVSRVYQPEGNNNNSTDSTSCIVTQRLANPTYFQIKVDCGEKPLEIPNGYKLYAMSDVNNGSRFGITELTSSDGGLTYTGDISKWIKSDGSDADKQSIYGHENNVETRLYMVPATTNVTVPSDLGDSIPKKDQNSPNDIEGSQTIQSHVVISYPSVPKDYVSSGADDLLRTVETHVDHVQITDKIFLDSFNFDNYSLEYLLNGYNIVALCDPEIGGNRTWEGVTYHNGDVYKAIHLMGAVLIHGELTGSTAFADSAVITVPSYVGKVDTSLALANTRGHNQNPPLLVLDDSNIVAGSNINGHSVNFGHNQHGITVADSSFIDWNALTSAVQSTSAALADMGRPITIDHDNYVLTLQSGEYVTISNPNNYSITVNIDGIGDPSSGETEGTVISFLDTGATQLPRIGTLDGMTPGDYKNYWGHAVGAAGATGEDGAGVSIIYNYPNASYVTTRTQGPEMGHIVAPQADVAIVSGDFNGSVVCNAAYSLSEGHVWGYHGSALLKGDSTGFKASKFLNRLDDDGNKIVPTDDQVFTFVMEELNPETGVWEYTAADVVTNNKSEIVFPEISFTKLSDVGEHYFRIRELNSSINGIESDDTEYIVKVDVGLSSDTTAHNISIVHFNTYLKVNEEGKAAGNSIIESYQEKLYKTDAHGNLIDEDSDSAWDSVNVTRYRIMSIYLDEIGDNSQKSEDVIQFVNTYFGKYCVAVTKSWDDDNNRDGVRPDGIIVELQKHVDTNNDGTADTWQIVTGIAPETQYQYTFDTNGDETTTYVDYAILNEANNWTHMVKGVDKYDENGNVIEYRWVEKAFVYGSGDDAVRIESVEGQNSEEKTTYTFTFYYNKSTDTIQAIDPDNTPAPEGFEVMSYTGIVTGIDVKSSDEDGGTITYVTGLMNTHETTSTSVSATKDWKNDDNNKLKLRKDIQLRLIGVYTVNEGDQTKTYEVTEIKDVEGNSVNPKTILANATGDGLTVKWDNLPKFYDGHEITYKVVEVGVPSGYAVSYKSGTGETEVKDGIVVDGQITVTNKLESGALEITKDMLIDNQKVTVDDNANKNREFYVQISYVAGDNTTWYVTQSNGLIQKTENSGAAITHIITPTENIKLTGLPFGEYTVTEVKDANGTPFGENETPSIGSMTFLSALSKISGTVEINKVYSQNDNSSIAKLDLVNAYTTGKYCVAVTKQWLTNGAVRADDDLVLYVKLQRTITPNDNSSWENVENIFLTSTDGTAENNTRASVITLNKANNWSAVAVGQAQMDAAGNRYSYRWVELAADSLDAEVLGYQTVHGFNTRDNDEKHAVGEQKTVQQNVKDGTTLIFLTKLTNSNVEAEIPVRKLVNSEDDTLFNLNTEFTVTINKAQNPETAFPSDETSILGTPSSITLHKNDVGEFVVSNITKPGTYTYWIQETGPEAGTVPGMTNDSEKKIVEIMVRWHENTTNEDTLLDHHTYLEVEYIRWKNENDKNENPWKYLVYNGSDSSIATVATVDVVNVYKLSGLKVAKTATLDGNEIPNTAELLYNKSYYVSVKGQQDGKYYATNGAVISEDDRWVEIKAGTDKKIEWTNLPAGTYVVEEQDAGVIGYTVTTTIPASPVTIPATDTAPAEVTITNAYTTDKTMAKVVKAWDDNDNQDGKRPDTVTMKLYANNEETGITVTLSDTVVSQEYKLGLNAVYNTASVDVATRLTGIVYNLPTYVNGVKQTYTWIEDQTALVSAGYTIKSIVPGTATYTIGEGNDAVTYSGDMVTITNTYDTSRYCLTVLKVWDDQNNKFNLRRSDITVELYKRIKGDSTVSPAIEAGTMTKVTGFKTDASSSTTVDSITLNSSNNWTAMVLGVDKYEDGKELEYFWKEVSVPAGYTLDTANTEVIDGITYIKANESSTRIGSIKNTLDTGKLTITKRFVFNPNLMLTDVKMDLRHMRFVVTGWDTSSKEKVVYPETDFYLTRFNETSGTYSLTIDNLPLGYYEVREDASGVVIASYTLTGTQIGSTDADISNLTSIAGDGGNISIGKDDASTAENENEKTVAIVNTYEHDKGNLSVTKKPLVNPVGSDETDKEFTFIVTLKNPDGTPHSGTYKGRIGSDEEINYVFGENGKNTTEIKLKSNQTLTLTGLPTGVTYTVSEAEDDTYTLTDKQGDTGVIVKDTTSAASASFTNTRKTGGLEITKTVDSDLTSDLTKTFGVVITLKNGTGESATAYSGTFSATKNGTAVDGGVTFTNGIAALDDIKHGDRIVITGLPIGLNYTVTETGADGFSVSYNGITGESSTGAITANTSIAITNTKQEGRLAVHKTVVSPVDADKASTTRFQFTIHMVDAKNAAVNDVAFIGHLTKQGAHDSLSRDRNITFTNGSATIDLAHDETMTLIGIPAGYKYYVEETPESGTLETGYSWADLSNFTTVSSGEVGTSDNKITVENSDTAKTATFTNTRKNAPLTIDKTVVSDVPAEQTAEYTFTVRLLSGTQLINGTFKADYYNDKTATTPTEGNKDITFTEGETTIAVKGGGKVVIKDVPVGTTVHVSESADSNFTSSRTDENGDVIIEAGLTESFKNERKTGELDVTKTVHSDEATDLTREYNFTVELFEADGTTPADLGITDVAGKTYGGMTFKTVEGKTIAAFTVTNGGKVSAEVLPVGLKYVVTEEGIDGIVQTSTGEIGTITGNGNNQANFTNTRAESGLIVSKEVISELARDKEKEFSFTLKLWRVAENSEQGHDLMANETFADAVIKRGKGITDETPTKLTTDANGQYNFTLTDGQILVIQHLPENAKYKVEEASEADFTVTKLGDEGTIRVNGANLAEFVNTRKPSELKITKIVNSPIEADQARTFEFKVYLYDLEKNEDGTEKEDIEANRSYLNAYIAGRHFEGDKGATFYVQAGHTLTLDGIPADVHYIVTEVLAADQEGRFEIVTEKDGVTVYPVTGITNASTPIEVTVTNERKVDNLILDKTVISPIEADQNKKFNYTIAFNRDLNGEFNAEVTGTGTVDGSSFTAASGETPAKVKFVNGRAQVTLTGGAKLTIKGVPTQMTYTIFETPDNDFTVDEDGLERTGTITDTSASASLKPSQVSYTNTRKTGELEVTKTVSGGTDADKNKLFSFTVTFNSVLSSIKVKKSSDEVETSVAPVASENNSNCTYSFTLKHGEKLNITGLPVGVTYTIEETSESGFVITKTGDTGTISAVKAVGAFTNTRQDGGLVVSKKVVSNVVADKTIDFAFTLTLSDTTITGQYGALYFENGVAGTISNETFTPGFTLKDGENVSVTGLPGGVHYTVTETLTDAQGQIFTKTESGTTGAISTTGNANAVVTNTRKTGDLEISKTVVSDNPADAGKLFTFTVELSVGEEPNKQMISGTYGGYTFDADGKATITLHGGDKVLLTGIPVGATWTVTEAAATDFITTASANGATATATNNVSSTISTTKSTAAFTNTVKTGKLTIQKTVTDGVGDETTKQYTFDIYLDADIDKKYGDVQFTDGHASVTVKGGSSISIEGLPVGVAYNVVETAASAEGFTVTYTNASGTITDNTAGVTVTVDNKHEKGNLQVDKSVFVDGADKSSTYADKTFYVKVYGEIGGVAYWVTEDSGLLSKDEKDAKIFTVKPGTSGKLTISNLPVGEYTVIEVADAQGTPIDESSVPGDLGSMTYLAELSRREDHATISGSAAATASLVNAYTSGKYCIAVTKQWLVNGEAYVDDSLTLTVKLQQKLSTAADADANWSDVKVKLDGGTEQDTITLNKANNWSAVAVGMPQMNDSGVRYNYRWVELNGTTVLKTGDVFNSWKVGNAVIEQSATKDGTSLIFLTRLNNSKVDFEIPVKKTVTGDYTGNEDYTVTLTAAETNPQAVGTDGMTLTPGNTLTLKRNEVKSFVLSSITTAGDYKFIVQETEPTNKVPGMTYDTAAKEVTFTVSLDADTGILSVKNPTVTEANPVVIENKYESGSLEISKTVVSDNPADKGVEFTFTVALKNADGTALADGTYGGVAVAGGTATIKLHGGDKALLSGLPVGTTYTVTEAAADGFKQSATGTGTITDGKKAEGTITLTQSTADFTNTRKTADLTIEKKLVSEVEADASAKYTFTIQLSEAINGTFSEVTFKDGKATVEISGAGSKKIEGLPQGVTYEIAEANAVNLTPDEAVKTGTLSEAATVTFTNTRETGKLTIKKTVVSSNANDSNKEFTFVVTLTGVTGEKTYSGVNFTNGVSEKITLKHNESKTIEGLPAGVAYSVAESEANKDNFVTTSTGETGTIGATGTSVAAFTNTKSEGGLVVSKKVVSAITADHSKEYTITVTLGDTTVNGTYGDARFANGVATLTGMKDGDVKVIEGLPNGVTYTVTETLNGDDGNTYTVTYTGATGEIEKDKTKSAVVTNTRNTTDLTISKLVVSAIASDKTDEAFLFTLTLNPAITGEYSGVYIEDGKAQLWLKHNQLITLKGIPYGTTYTVDEVDDARFTETHTGNESGELTDRAAEVAYKNTRKTADLTIEKKLVSEVAADANQKFTFTIQLSEAINGTFSGVTFTNGTATVEITGAGSKKIEGLPQGVTYEVAEAYAENLTPDAAVKTGTLSNDATVTFTNTRETGSLTIKKMVVSNDEADKNKEFSFKVTLTGLNPSAVQITYDGVKFTDGVSEIITLKDGESKTIKGLPAGVKYTVTESGADGFAVIASGDTGTIGATGTSVASFTNTKSYGGLIVSKKVLSAVEDDHSKEFTIKVTLEDNTINGTYGGAAFENGVATFSLKDSDVCEITGLTPGIKYTVEESLTADDGNLYTVTYKGKTTDTIAENETKYVVVTNTRKTTELTISKKVVSPLTADLTNKAFLFTLTLNPALTGNYSGVYIENGEAQLWLRNGQSITLKGIPVGTTYTVEEEADPRFTEAHTGKESAKLTEEAVTVAYTNTYEPATVSVPVVKIWEDENDFDGLRPVSVPIVLKQKIGDTTPTEVARFTLTEKDMEVGTTPWSHIFTDLPKNVVDIADDTVIEIQYLVEELQVDGYESEAVAEEFTLSSGETVSGFRITNTHVPVMTSASVTKVWDDNNNAMGNRPDYALAVLTKNNVETPISVELYATKRDVTTKSFWVDGVEYKATYEWDDVKGSYTVTVNDLPAYENGNRVIYGWKEGLITYGYSMSGIETKGTLTVITNRYDADRFCLTVSKIWDDRNNMDGIRPKTVTVELMANGEPAVFADGTKVPAVVLSEENNWTGMVLGVPIYKDYAPITYMWREKDVAKGYTVTTPMYAAGGYTDLIDANTNSTRIATITNKHEPALTATATVRKIWSDNNDAAGMRPKSLTVTLYGNGYEVTKVILDASNSWSAKVDKLPAAKGTEPITYTWREQEVISYTQTESKTEGDVTTITNAYRTRGTSTNITNITNNTTNNTTTNTTNNTTNNTGTTITRGGGGTIINNYMNYQEVVEPQLPGEPLVEIEDYGTPLGINVIINHVGDCFD